MEANEIYRILNSKNGYVAWDTEYSDHISGLYYTWDGKPVKVEVVDSNRHEEGNWHTDLYVVFSVYTDADNLQYFKKTGYYQSHDGEYWDGAVTEVQPQEKTVTVWNDSSDPYWESEYSSYDDNSYY